MSTKPVMKPGPDHPITIERTPGRVRVTVAGRMVADTANAVTLREADYDPVQYIPVADVDMDLLHATDHVSYCPFKGDCSYYSIALGGDKSENAVWTYQEPFDAVAEIKGRLAFYPSRVDRIDIA